MAFNIYFCFNCPIYNNTSIREILWFLCHGYTFIRVAKLQKKSSKKEKRGRKEEGKKGGRQRRREWGREGWKGEKEGGGQWKWTNERGVWGK